MANIKRSKLISILKEKDYSKAFNKEIENVGKGWAIFWDGQQIKPKVGNNILFASKNSAIQALDRNCNIYRSFIDDVFTKTFGFNQRSPEYDKYTGRSKGYNEMTEQEKANWEETRKVESFCHNALKTVLVPTWEEQGRLKFVEFN